MPLTTGLKSKETYALLVPCYNAEKYIESFLQNIANLITSFDEIIFYNDASTDNTSAILKSKRFKVIDGMENKGPAYARNILANETKCDWFHFHDIDDQLVESFLQKTKSIAEEGIYDVVLCNVDWYDSSRENILLKWHYSNEQINRDPLDYTISHPIGGINGLYKKSKFLKIGGFNTNLRIWEDADLHVRLAANAAKFYIIEEVLSISIRYDESASSNQSVGWTTRLDLLQTYFKTYRNSLLNKTIGKQAQVAASNLVLVNEYKAAKEALKLSESCSVKVPDNNSILWKLIKAIAPTNVRIGLRLAQLKFAFIKVNN